MLKFSPANAKTRALKNIFPQITGKVYSLDLPSGITCPGALLCKSQAVIDNVTGRATIKDGSKCQFRCFSASQEILFPAVRKARQHNLSLIKTAKTVNRITKLILDSLPKDTGVVRLHVAGDFFSIDYLRAVYQVAFLRPGIVFYGYTKSLHHLKTLVAEKLGNINISNGMILSNFILTASRGGKYDSLISEMGIREAIVVYSTKEASDMGLVVDHTDEYAIQPGTSFALLLHGTQPKGTSAASALQILKKSGLGSYHREGK